jgi:hypothetical protein
VRKNNPGHVPSEPCTNNPLHVNNELDAPRNRRQIRITRLKKSNLCSGSLDDLAPYAQQTG